MTGLAIELERVIDIKAMDKHYKYLGLPTTISLEDLNPKSSNLLKEDCGVWI